MLNILVPAMFSFPRMNLEKLYARPNIVRYSKLFQSHLHAHILQAKV